MRAQAAGGSRCGTVTPDQSQRDCDLQPGVATKELPRVTCGHTTQLRRSCANRIIVSMPQSFSAVYVHLVFSTKERRPFLRDRAIRESLHAYLGAASKELECAPLRVGGVE